MAMKNHATRTSIIKYPTATNHTTRLTRVGRKGIFFTLMAIMVISFLLVSEKTASRAITTTKEDSTSAMTRVAVLNSFVGTFENHIIESTRTSTYLALQNISGTMRNKGEYKQDMNRTIYDCMQNPTTPTPCLNATQKINYSVQTLITLAQNDMNINVSYHINNITLYEEQPFTVTAIVNISYNITDGAFAQYSVRNKILDPIVIDMNGIEDPLFAVAIYNGNFTASARREFKSPAISKSDINSTSFIWHYNNKSYIQSEGRGPSILQRYQGKITSTSACCGIETVVDFPSLSYKINSTPYSWVNMSFVDYLLLNKTIKYNCTMNLANPNANVTSTKDRSLRMDADHIFNVYRINTTPLDKFLQGQDTNVKITCST